MQHSEKMVKRGSKAEMSEAEVNYKALNRKLGTGGRKDNARGWQT